MKKEIYLEIVVEEKDCTDRIGKQTNVGVIHFKRVKESGHEYFSLPVGIGDGLVSSEYDLNDIELKSMILELVSKIIEPLI